jgi:O-antigen/teichoic acid export membrane protein
MAGNRILRDALGVANTNTLTTLLRFVIGVLVARELGPEGKGLFATVLVVPNLLISFAELGVRRSSIQHIGEKKIPENEIISSLLFFFLLASFAGMLISGIVFASMNNQEISLEIIILVLLGIPVQLFNKFVNGVFIGQQRFRIFNLCRGLPVVLYLAALLLFVSGLRMAISGALAAILVSNFFTSWVALYFLRKRNTSRPKVNVQILKSLISLGIVYALAMFLMKLNFRIDILILQYLSDFKEVGIYNQGVTVAEGWQAPFTLGAVVLSQTANANNKTELNQNIGQLFRLTFIMVLLASAAVWLFSPWFVPFVYGKAFTASVAVVQGIIPAIVLIIMARMLASHIAGLRKTHLVIWVYLPALLINIGLNFILIPMKGAMGAVIASNISYSLSAIGIIWVYCRVSGQNLAGLIRYRKADFDFIPGLLQKLRLRFRVKPPRRF